MERLYLGRGYFIRRVRDVSRHVSTWGAAIFDTPRTVRTKGLVVKRSQVADFLPEFVLE